MLATIRSISGAVAGLISFLRALANLGESAKDRAAGRAEAERDQARAGAQVQADVAASAAADVSEDDAIAQLKRGEG